MNLSYEHPSTGGRKQYDKMMIRRARVKERETKSNVIDIVYYNIIILYLGWSLLCFKASGIPSLVCYVIYLIYTYLHSILYCKYTYQYVLNIQTLFKVSYSLQ